MLQWQPGKKVYFISDSHLGVPGKLPSIERERLLCKWLDEKKADACAIYLLGDLFDFWYEYKYLVPKGYVRVLGKLAEIRDSGIPIEVFTGNHDMWMFGYFEKELNIQVHTKPIEREINSKKFILGHGDGLGPGDKGYKLVSAQ